MLLGSQHRRGVDGTETQRSGRPLHRGAKDAAGSPVLRCDTKTLGSSPETGLFNKWDKSQKLRVYTLFAWLSLPLLFSSAHPSRPPSTHPAVRAAASALWREVLRAHRSSEVVRSQILHARTTPSGVYFLASQNHRTWRVQVSGIYIYMVYMPDPFSNNHHGTGTRHMELVYMPPQKDP